MILNLQLFSSFITNNDNFMDIVFLDEAVAQGIRAKNKESGGEQFQIKRNSVGLTNAEMSKFYSAISNNKKGLLIGDYGVLLIDELSDEVNPGYTLICYDGEKISPAIKSVYKISDFDYNIYNDKKYVIDVLVKWEKVGLKNEQIRNALQDILVDTGGVFKKYNRKTHRFNTLAKSGNRNNKANIRANANQSNGTGVSKGVGKNISAGKGNATGVNGNNKFSDRFDTD